jgi:very-short-patch-repair endonuclease
MNDIICKYLIYKRALEDFYDRVDRESIYFSLSEHSSIVRNIKSPIEQIMLSILLNCYISKNSTTADILQECIHPFKFTPIIEHQLKIKNYIVDFCIEIKKENEKGDEFIISKYIIECDGHDFHEKTKEQARKDKKRDRDLIALGYKVLRFTGSEIYNNYEDLIEEINKIINTDYDVYMDGNYE